MAQNELITFTNLERVLTEYGNEVKVQYQQNLQVPRYTKGDHPVLTDRIASGQLFNSVQFELDVNGGTYNVVLSLMDYWKYIEYGRTPGKFPPTSKILEWIRIKPVIPRPSNNGKIPKPQQLAFLIGRKIANDGYEGSHELEEANNDLMKKYETRIVLALSQDLQGYLQKIVIESGL